MKQLLAMVLLLSLATLPAAQHKDNAVKRTITNLEYNWAEAQKAGDAATVAPMLADGFVNTDVDGQRYGKDQLLSNLKGGKWEQNAISEVKVAVFGDTAIVIGTCVGKGIDGDGSRIDRQEHWTDTWVKMGDGKWQCVASQQTTLSK